MAEIEDQPQVPDGSWNVSITDAPDDDWADGTLVISTDAYGNRFMTYAGNSTDQNNYNANNVTWRVTLAQPNPNPPPATKSCDVKFSGGDYSSATGGMSKGKAQSACFKGKGAGTPEDDWTASPL